MRHLILLSLLILSPGICSLAHSLPQNVFSTTLGVNTSIPIDVLVADNLHNMIHSYKSVSSFVRMPEPALAFLGSVIMAILYADYSEAYTKKTSSSSIVSAPKNARKVNLLYKFFEPMVSLAFWQVISHIFLQVVVAFHPAKNDTEYSKNAVQLFRTIMPSSALLPYTCSLAYESLYGEYASSDTLILSFVLGGLYWISRRSIRNLSLKPDSPTAVGRFYSLFFYFVVYILTFVLTMTHKNLLSLSTIFEAPGSFLTIFLIGLMLFGKWMIEGFVSPLLLFSQLREYVRYDYFYTIAFTFVFSTDKLSRAIAAQFGLSGFSVDVLNSLRASPFTYLVFLISKVVAMSW